MLFRNFLESEQIKVIYSPIPFQSLDKLSLLKEVAFINIDENIIDNKSESNLIGLTTNIKTDFGKLAEAKLIKTLVEVDGLNIPEIKDNYKIRIMLKDKSVYANAPRRLALKERIQIREITDDLLARGIIQYSILPRIVRKWYPCESVTVPFACTWIFAR